ncbi:MAG: preprotein translocase subunit SecE [Cyanobacteria bacterium CAN_BIN43]|nr:preprotein translocase subunit SecE [Cyanobacteria bacterium CAN_BIN43]
MAKKDEIEAKEQEPKDLKGSKDSKEVSKPTASGGNMVSSFVQGSKEELDKVVWPSRQQLISESIAVVLMVTLSATLIYLVDNLFRWAATQVF